MRDLTPKTEKTNSGPSSKSDAPVRGAPGLPACMTAALGQSAVFVGLGLIFLTAFFTCLDPWVADAVSAQTFGFVSLRQVLYNLVKLFEGKGGYAQWLWGVLVFLSLSIWFHEAGKIAFKKIISRGVTESASLPPLSALERFSCHWILGSGIWSLVWFFLGLAGLYRKSLALALVFAGLLFLLRKAHLGMQSFSARSPEPEPKNLFTFSAVAAAVLFLWVLSWILPANHPVYYWDTWMVNLALPGYYAAESRLVYNPFNIYSYFSQNSEMLTVWALLAGSKAAAFLLVWGFFAALLLFFYGWISRAASRAAALCAISLFISSQLGWWLATNIKNDLQPAVF